MNDDIDNSDDEGSKDPSDALFERAQFLRELREADEAERNANHHLCVDDNDAAATAVAVDEHDGSFRLTNGQRILDYDAYLKHQRYYDDCKHIDYRYIDFGVGSFGTLDAGANSSLQIHPQTRRSTPRQLHPLVIEQDKSLGKGGLCWDAAFILGEYLGKSILLGKHVGMDSNTRHCNIGSDCRRRRWIELGSGTGLCGLLVAQALLLRNDTADKEEPSDELLLTDLPELLPLLQRNLSRNFGTARRQMNDGSTGTTLEQAAADVPNQPSINANLRDELVDEANCVWQEYFAKKGYNNDDDVNDDTTIASCGDCSIHVAAVPLDWGDMQRKRALIYDKNKDDVDDDDNGCAGSTTTPRCFDVVFGADIVASLYDPILLARTIAYLSSSRTMVYIGFKERLSTIHRQFEAEMAQLFTTTRILPPEMVQQYSRNHNPNVSIFVAYDKRVVKGTDEEVATLDS